MLSIYGLGIVSPAGVSQSAIADRWQSQATLVPAPRSAEDQTLGLFLPPLPVPTLSGGRRMSPWLRMGLAAGQEAGQGISAEERNRLNIVSATGFGSLKHTADFLSNLIRNQESEPQPANFIFSVHNAAATQTAIALGCRGANYTLSSVDTGFEQALQIADKLNGQMCLVLAADEYQPLANDSLRKARYWQGASCREGTAPACQGTPAQCPGEGAVGLLVGPVQPGRIAIRAILTSLLPRTRPDVGVEREQIQRVLAEAGADWKTLDAVITNASHAAAWDRGLEQVWDAWPEAEGVPRTSYKPWTGEFPAASGCGLALAVLAMQGNGWPGLTDRPLRTVLFYNRSRFGFRSMVVLQR